MFANKSEIKLLGRLKKRSDFLRVQSEGNKWVSKSMIVELAPNDSLGPRYGLTVSKKVSKSAVVRNHIRRRLKATACDVLPALKGNNIDVVLVGRELAGDRDYKDLQQDLRWCLGKLGYDVPKGKSDEVSAD